MAHLWIWAAIRALGHHATEWSNKLQQATTKRTPSGVDEMIHAIVRFGDVDAELSCNMGDDVEEVAYLRLEGTKGRLFVNNPIAPHSGHYIETEIEGVHRKYTIGGGTTYDYQLDA